MRIRIATAAVIAAGILAGCGRGSGGGPGGTAEREVGPSEVTVVPTLDAPIVPGRSTVWCASFQAAWNRLAKDIVKAPPVVKGAEELCRRLNGTSPVEADLPVGAFYAAAGWTKDGIQERIRKEMGEAGISDALQLIRFRLTREGAELQSEAKILVRPAASRFIFDGPFLVSLKKRAGGRPFFALWVDGPEILEKWRG